MPSFPKNSFCSEKWIKDKPKKVKMVSNPLKKMVNFHLLLFLIVSFNCNIQFGLDWFEFRFYNFLDFFKTIRFFPLFQFFRFLCNSLTYSFTILLLEISWNFSQKRHFVCFRWWSQLIRKVIRQTEKVVTDNTENFPSVLVPQTVYFRSAVSISCAISSS